MACLRTLLLTCLSANEDKTDSIQVAAPINIACCKSNIEEDEDHNDGATEFIREDILQSTASRQFLKCPYSASGVKETTL
jgi:hypothetical protein